MGNTNKITAEDFLNSEVIEFENVHAEPIYTEYEVIQFMIEFAKVKVTEAIDEIKRNVDWGISQNDDGQEPFHHESNIFVDKRTIDSAYDINNIK